MTVTTAHRTASFSAAHPPALRVEPGSTVTFETGDVAYERLSNGETVETIGLENFNLITGPVFVEGAAPGDALRVEIVSVEIKRAWSVWMPNFGGLGHHATEVTAKEIPHADGLLHISERVHVPIEPMIGCIGVAPAEGEGSTFMPAYPFGGNMDLRELSPGATVYLPVQVDGGLLSLGDLHAAMGTAEPTWVSLEAAGRATIRIHLEKDMPLPTPRIVSGGSTLCIGMGETLEAAHQHALDQAYDVLIA
ncbi:MAG: acetamidase/formamidase family protein, partial [Bacteroidota bacterium]